MTIPLLEVSFNGIFEYGQGYVALSRATCLEGLTLRSFQVRYDCVCFEAVLIFKVNILIR